MPAFVVCSALSSFEFLRTYKFVPYFFLFPDFHELWCSVMSICLLTEVKQQWAMLVLELR